MAEVTRQEFTELRTMVEETYWLARQAVRGLYKQEDADKIAASIKSFCSPEERRWRSEVALYKLGLDDKNSRPLMRLQEEGLLTLDEVAARGRSGVSAIPGVGAKTVAQLDAAMADRGLTWAEVA